MGKGKAWKDKASKTRYWSENHRLTNKLRRIRKNNGAKGEEMANAYEKLYRK